MSDAALAVVDAEVSGIEKPHALMKQATDAAAACREIVLRTAMTLGEKRYVKVEGWASIAAVYNCTPSIREVVEEDRGVKAIAELKAHDGRLIATAEGFCGLDEPMWANRAMYARRGMAQTRAVSRVCRTAFAFVVTLIDSGLQTTPAEEIPYGGEESHASSPSPIIGISKPPLKPDLQQLRTKENRVRFGRVKGQYLCDISQDELDWQLAAATKSVAANDPKWGDANKTWLASVQAEVNSDRRKS